MKKKLYFALLSALALCMLCASAGALVTDGNCWDFYLQAGGQAFLTDYNQEFDTEGEYLKTVDGKKILTVPASVTSDHKSYNVYGIDGVVDIRTLRVDEVILPEGLVMIVGDGFKYSFVSSVTLPSTLEVLGSGVFRGCGALTELKGFEQTKVKTIPSSAFRDCGSLYSLALPAGVTKIDTYAFSGCFDLEVTVPAGIRWINDFAFFDSFNLRVAFGGTKEQWPAGVEAYYCARGFRADTSDGYSFGWCGGRALDESYLYWSMDREGNLIINGYKDEAEENEAIWSAAWTAENVRTVTVGAKWVDLYGVDEYFGRMTGLQEIRVEKGNPDVTVEDKILYSGNQSRLVYCLGPTGEVTIPATVTEIPEGAFRGCTGITRFKVEVGNAAFKADENGLLLSADGKRLVMYPHVESGTITLPADVEIVESKALSSCNRGLAVTIPEGTGQIGDREFYRCAGLTSVKIPETVTRIGDLAFVDCTDLTSVKIPESVTRIDDAAFKNCADLISVEFAGGCEICSEAFAYCKSLT